MKSNQTHWDKIFSQTKDEKLGWYEEDFSKTLEFLELIPDYKNKTIFLPGVGTSNLAEMLLNKDSTLILNDISQEAIKKLQEKLIEHNENITWLCQDVCQPLETVKDEIDIWIDRAVLHFLNASEDILAYFKNVKSHLKLGGYIILAEFSKIGADKCAGLDVNRYSLEDFKDNLGNKFELLHHSDHVYMNPSGDPRPYIYALFKKLN